MSADKIRYKGVYKCRLCGDRFTRDICIVDTFDADTAIREVDQSVSCNCGKIHEDGNLLGFAEVVGVVEIRGEEK